MHGPRSRPCQPKAGAFRVRERADVKVLARRQSVYLTSILMLTSATLCAAQNTSTLTTDDPRAYGYQVGSRFSRSVVAQVPASWRLDPASVPSARRNQPIELRQVTLSSQTTNGTTQHRIKLDYQVFLAPNAVRTLELPPWFLKFDAAGQTEELRVDAWPVVVAPLVTAAVSPRTGLGDMQPDTPPHLINTRAAQLRLMAYAGLALALLGWLAVVYLGPPWRAARQRPFGRAWRELRRLPPAPERAQWQAALRCLHEALNRSAGAVTFSHNLPAFVHAQPRFKPLQAELADFLQRSQKYFFNADDHKDDHLAITTDAAWLKTLAQRLFDTERGLA